MIREASGSGCRLRLRDAKLVTTSSSDPRLAILSSHLSDCLLDEVLKFMQDAATLRPASSTEGLLTTPLPRKHISDLVVCWMNLNGEGPTWIH